MVPMLFGANDDCRDSHWPRLESTIATPKDEQSGFGWSWHCKEILHFNFWKIQVNAKPLVAVWIFESLPLWWYWPRATIRVLEFSEIKRIWEKGNILFDFIQIGNFIQIEYWMMNQYLYESLFLERQGTCRTQIFKAIKHEKI